MYLNLYLFKCSNYYNRIAYYRSSIDDYGSYIALFENIAFNPNDGIYTEQVLNFDASQMPDYIVCVTEEGQIDSRWFIIESKRIRAGQYKFELYRDVIADWREQILDAPTFIEKAMLGFWDPAIFNSEQMTFNQIKQSETQIKDNTKSAWIVGYFSKANIPLENRTINIPSNDVVISGEYNTLDDFPYKNGITAYPEDPTFRVDFTYGSSTCGIGWDRDGNIKSPSVDLVPSDITGISVPRDFLSSGSFESYASDLANEVQNSLYDESNITSWSDRDLNSYVECATKNFTEEYVRSNGKIYKIGNQYFVFLAVENTESNTVYSEISTASSLGIDIAHIFSISNVPGADNMDSVGFEWKQKKYETLLVEYNLEAIDFVLAENPVNTEDAPYNIFAIPYHKWLRDNANLIYSDAINSKRIADAIQRKLGSYLIDLQLLPYCPFPEAYRRANGSLRTDLIPQTGLTLYQDITMEGQDITEEGNYITSILYCQSSTFSLTVDSPVIAPWRNNAIDFKISNECDVYRLCSPNYNGQFEFSAAKNRGVMGWNIDCTYKPFSPYIHVAPIFRGLYGNDFDDARGLICGGDFSLAQISDAWIQYQIQNKNFQSIFDRNIENIEVQNKYSRIGEIASIGVNSITASFSGAMGAGSVGGPYAAAAGAIIGGATSLAGGVADQIIREKLRSEAIDYSKDQFGYQLQNIRALPYSLTKVSAYNANNKIFPFVEYYTCTEIEKQALRNKITYNGMTVMRIGKIRDFIKLTPTYIKGKLIRLENISDDYHVVKAISEELNKGVFI